MKTLLDPRSCLERMTPEGRARLRRLILALLLMPGCGGQWSYVRDVQPRTDGTVRLERCTTKATAMGAYNLEVRTRCSDEIVKPKTPADDDASE